MKIVPLSEVLLSEAMRQEDKSVSMDVILTNAHNQPSQVTITTVFLFNVLVNVSLYLNVLACTLFSGWLGSVVVGRWTSDQKIAGSTPGQCTSAPSLTVFRSRLKTYLFSRSFS